LRETRRQEWVEGGIVVSVDWLITGLATVALLIYLIYSLLRPEEF
jgi:K+-transporting ATPase KdpF subunit